MPRKGDSPESGSLKGYTIQSATNKVRAWTAAVGEGTEKIEAELGEVRELIRSKARSSSESSDKSLSPEELNKLIEILHARFDRNMHLHRDLVAWPKVEKRLREATPKKLWSLKKMEETGGEPDLIDYDYKTGECTFFDCSAESPSGRVNLCYNRVAEDSAKKRGWATNGNAVDMAAEMGTEILDEAQYRKLQELGVFDTKMFPWIKTPDGILSSGQALAVGRHHNYNNDADTVTIERVDLYHRGDYRSFRSCLKI